MYFIKTGGIMAVLD